MINHPKEGIETNFQVWTQIMFFFISAEQHLKWKENKWIIIIIRKPRKNSRKVFKNHSWVLWYHLTIFIQVQIKKKINSIQLKVVTFEMTIIYFTTNFPVSFYIALITPSRFLYSSPSWHVQGNTPRRRGLCLKSAQSSSPNSNEDIPHIQHFQSIS